MRPRAGGRAAAIVLAMIAAGPAMSAEVGASGMRPVRSLLELRNDGVTRQQWDLTCGAAAIATLLNLQFARPVTERQVAVAMLRHTRPLLVRSRLGFSLLDLKHYAASQGLEATGYSHMTLDDAVAVAPLIVPVRLHGFRHFVVLRGRQGDRVLLADPAFGNRTQRLEDFTADWANNIGFVVTDPRDPRPAHPVAAPAALFLVPPGQAVRQSAAVISIRAVP